MKAKGRIAHKTAYPHIVKTEGVNGGAATIEGTRMGVWHIVEYYYKVGMSVEEIVMEWTHINPAQVFSALAYYHDNRAEIDALRERNSYEYWLKHHAHASAQTTSQ